MFELIKEEEPEPLQNCDQDITDLVQMMLRKNPADRPDAWELAKIPYIRERIDIFAEKHNCKEEVVGVFELDPALKNPENQKKTQQVKYFRLRRTY